MQCIARNAMMVAALALTALAPAAPAAVRSGEDEIEFSYSDPGATSVSLAGEFNGWNTTATPMRDPDGDGTWTVVVPLPAGEHQYKFVVNGGTWVADPDNPRRGGDFDNSVVEVGTGGAIVTGAGPAAPAAPSGTPLLSNTPLHSKVYIGGFFRMFYEGASEVDDDTRLRLLRPDDQFNLDVTANLNPKVWGSVRLQVRTGIGGANELSTELYKAQSNFVEDAFQVKAFYNDEVYSTDDPLELIGHIDLRGTIEEEERSFGQGQQGILLQMHPFGSHLDLMYSDTFDEDIFNPNEPTVLDPRKDGLNQNTGTDVLVGRWTTPVGAGRLGLAYRGEFSDWWVNFTKDENAVPIEIQNYLDAQTDRRDDQKSDNFELTNDRQFGALDLSWPVRERWSVFGAAGYGWYESRWDLGNREDIQGQGFVNGDVDIPIGNTQLYRGKIGVDGEWGSVRAGISHEVDIQLGMDAGESEVVYRTQPGSEVEDRDEFVVQDIVASYQDVNGTDALDIQRLGPAPERVSHITELDVSYRQGDFTLDLEVDRRRDNLDYVLFFETGAGASLDRSTFRVSPRLRWNPFDGDRYHVSLDTELWWYDNPSELDEIAAMRLAPSLPAQGYGSLVAIESTELVLRGLVPAERVLRVPLDLRFNLRAIDYAGPERLIDADGNELDLDDNFFAPFAALVYQPAENVEVQLGYGVDPTFYDVISPGGWPNGRQQFRDEYLIERRLDPYNPINVLLAEQALEDRTQIVINALVTF